MGTIFLVIGRAKRAPHWGCSIEISGDNCRYVGMCRYVSVCVGMSVVSQINCVGGNTWPESACSKSFLGGKDCDTRVLFIWTSH